MRSWAFKGEPAPKGDYRPPTSVMRMADDDKALYATEVADAADVADKILPVDRSKLDQLELFRSAEIARTQ